MQVRLLQGKHIHLNLIRTASFDASQQKQIDLALQVMRNIYATVSLGIGRIQRFVIPPGHEVIDDDAEFHHLINEFSVPNVGIDVFLVRLIMGDASGKSPVNGSCDKDAKDDSGCVIGIENNQDFGPFIGQVLAHEVGHYLGLRHVIELSTVTLLNIPESVIGILDDNLMFPESPNGGQLTGGQGGEMKLHCSMRAGCQT
jgi:hypothetical protein